MRRLTVCATCLRVFLGTALAWSATLGGCSGDSTTPSSVAASSSAGSSATPDASASTCTGSCLPIGDITLACQDPDAADGSTVVTSDSGLPSGSCSTGESCAAAVEVCPGSLTSWSCSCSDGIWDCEKSSDGVDACAAANASGG
ncbi:MAG: hypothetical protein ABSF69_13755 [Polyangiaceae bacterium]